MVDLINRPKILFSDAQRDLYTHSEESIAESKTAAQQAILAEQDVITSDLKALEDDRARLRADADAGDLNSEFFRSKYDEYQELKARTKVSYKQDSIEEAVYAVRSDDFDAVEAYKFDLYGSVLDSADSAVGFDPNQVDIDKTRPEMRKQVSSLQIGEAESIRTATARGKQQFIGGAQL